MAHIPLSLLSRAQVISAVVKIKYPNTYPFPSPLFFFSTTKADSAKNEKTYVIRFQRD